MTTHSRIAKLQAASVGWLQQRNDSEYFGVSTIYDSEYHFIGWDGVNFKHYAEAANAKVSSVMVIYLD